MFSFIANKLKQAVNSLSPSRKGEIKEFAKNFLDDIKDDIKKFDKNSTKQKKDPDAPKRAKNPYICFSTEKRHLIQEENPDMSPIEVTQKIAELWRELSDDEKDEYRKMSQEDKERYSSEISEYKPDLTDKTNGKNGKKKDPKAPKRSRSAYIFFCITKRSEIKSENEDLSSPNLMKKIGEIWSSMDDDDKEEYNNMAKKDKKRYQEEIEKYESSSDSNESNESNESNDESDDKPTKEKNHEPEAEPEKPKVQKQKEQKAPRAKSAYVNFCSKNRNKIKEEFPELTFGDLSKKLGEMWRSLSDVEKEFYTEV